MEPRRGLAAKGAAAALLAALALSCDSQVVDDTISNDAGQDHWSAAEALASVTGLDGTWDITFTNHPWYSGGSLVIGNTVGTATLIMNEENTEQSPGCTYVESRDQVDLTIAPTMVTGTNTHLRQVEGVSCPLNLDPGTAIDQIPLSGMDTGSLTTPGPSAFGMLGGTWHATSPYGACDVTFKSSMMSGTCADGTTFTATLSANAMDLSGQSNAGFEFAAHRH